MENQIISKAPEFDESEIKALINNFDTIGGLLNEHLTIFSNPILTPESIKMCNEGLVLIKKLTQKCLEHYGMRYLPNKTSTTRYLDMCRPSQLNRQQVLKNQKK